MGIIIKKENAKKSNELTNQTCRKPGT